MGHELLSLKGHNTRLIHSDVLVLGKFSLEPKLFSETEGLTLFVCFEILEPPSTMTMDGGFKISKQMDHSKPSISLSGFRHKPNFPNTNRTGLLQSGCLK
jgi:hypothetical protein